MSVNSIDIVDGIRQLYCEKINTISSFSKQSKGTRQWLREDSNIYPQSIIDSDAIEIITYTPEKPLECVAYDIQRLSCASLETMSSLCTSINNDKFLAWQLIQMYYAAFYAAHSILKICGLGLTQIDNTIINNLKSNGKKRNIITPAINAGIYCVDINRNNHYMVIYKVNKYDDSHRGLWARFIDLLNIINGSTIRTDDYNSACVRPKQSNDSLSYSIWEQYPNPDAQLVFNRISSLLDLLNQNSRNWLSSIRNNVNYSQQYGVWFPYKNIIKNYKDILGSKKIYMQSPLCDEFQFGNKPELIQYIKACHFIVSLNREIVIDLSKRHPESRSFLKNNAIRLINQYAK